MTGAIRLYSQIALLRKGPQDVPHSAALLAATILGYIAITFGISALLLPTMGPWWKILAVDVVFTLAWYAVLMRATGRPKRFMQTTTAVFGYQAILSPPSIASAWLLHRFGEDELWQLPVVLIYIAIVIWMIVANSHILKAALEWPRSSCVALVILQFLFSQLLLTWLLK